MTLEDVSMFSMLSIGRMSVVAPLLGIAMAAASASVAGAQPAETTIPDKVRLFIPYKEYSQEDNKRILDMYKWLRVADVSDGMDVVGLQDVGTVDAEIHALWKDTEKFTHRTVGIAVTARYVPTNRREPKMTTRPSISGTAPSRRKRSPRCCILAACW
jgi:hypothetical protein